MVEEVRVVLSPSGSAWVHHVLLRRFDPKSFGDVCISVCARDGNMPHTIRAYEYVQEPPVLPRCRASSAVIEAFDNIKLADPTYYRPDVVLMQIGVEYYHRFLKGRVLKQTCLPTAQNTEFGWVLTGPCPI